MASSNMRNAASRPAATGATTMKGNCGVTGSELQAKVDLRRIGRSEHDALLSVKPVGFLITLPIMVVRANTGLRFLSRPVCASKPLPCHPQQVPVSATFDDPAVKDTTIAAPLARSFGMASARLSLNALSTQLCIIDIRFASSCSMAVSCRRVREGQRMRTHYHKYRDLVNPAQVGSVARHP
jgi:hypothetical protein